MNRRLALFFLTLALIGSVLVPAQAQSILELVRSFDYPGAAYTYAQGINDVGDIAGFYTNASDFGTSYAFVRSANGSFSDPIVAPVDNVQTTKANAINNNGVIAGQYTTGENTDVHGFFLEGGVFTLYDYPGASQTLINGINDVGDFVGTFVLGDGTHGGFASIGGNLIPITIPGAQVYLVGDINNAGEIVGSYTSNRVSGGFRRASDGTLRYPIRADHNFGLDLWGTNESNVAVGDTSSGGFVVGVYVAGGGDRFLYYSLPGTNFNELTGINAQGLICGWGSEPSAAGVHAYIVRRRNSRAP